MVKRIVLGLLAAVALLLLLFAIARPYSFRVERSIVIKAEPAKVYALLNDFHQFPSWSPWQSLDPAMRVPHKGLTVVTWVLYGPGPYISKVMGVFVSMDSMIGKNFERGLTALKAVAEK